MHYTSLHAGKYFAETYGKPGYTVVDIGGSDLNGSLRNFFTERDMKYICVDIEPHKSVDVVMKPGDPFPFETGSVDLIVSTSCFEHDPCFWITFKEMCRILKQDGYIYINGPSNGPYHKHPGDNWRFYPDAGQALAYWSGISYKGEETFPVKLVETFFIQKSGQVWIDFIGIWKRSDSKESDIIVSENMKNDIGPLRQKLLDNKFNIRTCNTN
jgi:SAM-dependent methyltransferase